MKLLDWVHRKFRQNNGDVFKDYTGSGPTCNCLCLRPSPEEPHLHRRRPCHGLFADVGYLDGDREAVLYEGLLTIGTLGSGPIEETEGDNDVIEPMTVEAIAEKDVGVATEAELIMVGEELEKVLLEEAEKEVADGMSSARPSHAGGKGTTVMATSTCPLQGFLFGSTVEAADTVGRKEGRASLGELFMMSRMAEEEYGGGKVEDSGGDKKPIRLVTVKKMVQGCRKTTSYSSRGPAPLSSTKFRKILKIFHRKVHPDNNMPLHKPERSHKQKNKENASLCYEGDLGGSGGRGSLDDTYRNDGAQSFKSHSTGGRSSTEGSHEYWIKTDSDYLVLEL